MTTWPTASAPAILSDNMISVAERMAKKFRSRRVGFERAYSGFCAAAIPESLSQRCNYSGLSPSASNCRLHSVDGSRSRSIGASPGSAAPCLGHDVRSLSDHPLAPDPEVRLQHFLVDLPDTGHRQLGYEFYVLGRVCRTLAGLNEVDQFSAFGRAPSRATTTAVTASPHLSSG